MKYVKNKAIFRTQCCTLCFDVPVFYKGKGVRCLSLSSLRYATGLRLSFIIFIFKELGKETVEQDWPKTFETGIKHRLLRGHWHYRLVHLPCGFLVQIHLFFKKKIIYTFYTSPKASKYSLIFSSGVSGERPPTNIFFTGSLDFMALALLGSITFPLSLCSFCVITFDSKQMY